MPISSSYIKWVSESGECVTFYPFVPLKQDACLQIGQGGHGGLGVLGGHGEHGRQGDPSGHGWPKFWFYQNFVHRKDVTGKKNNEKFQQKITNNCYENNAIAIHSCQLKKLLPFCRLKVKNNFSINVAGK